MPKYTSYKGKKEILEGKGCQKKADICHRTQVKFWFKFKYPQYSISITARKLRFQKIYTKSGWATSFVKSSAYLCLEVMSKTRYTLD